MTTILVIIIIYLAIAHIFNFVDVANSSYLTDFEDLILNLLWINKIVKNYKRKKTQK